MQMDIMFMSEGSSEYGNKPKPHFALRNKDGRLLEQHDPNVPVTLGAQTSGDFNYDDQ